MLTGVTPDNDAYHEELFGPVAIVYRVESEDEAVEVANDTPFGLGSYVFTTDADQALRVADRIEAGMVFVNIVGADAAELPFGGVKRSGFGRELGRYGDGGVRQQEADPRRRLITRLRPRTGRVTQPSACSPTAARAGSMSVSCRRRAASRWSPVQITRTAVAVAWPSAVRRSWPTASTSRPSATASAASGSGTAPRPVRLAAKSPIPARS